MQTVSEHSWVHETYDTIIEYPFHKNILSLHDKQNFDLMNGGVFNVDHRGVIYTERKNSRSIKYLKAIQDIDGLKDKYSLFGNTQSNTMECIGDKECIMYTAGGNDEVNQQKYSKDIYIADFNDKNDKIILYYKEWLGAIGYPNNTDESFYNSGKLNGVIPLGGQYDSDGKMVGGDQVVVEGYTPDKVEDWMEVAKAKEQYVDSKTGKVYVGAELKRFKNDNPVQIQ